MSRSGACPSWATSETARARNSAEYSSRRSRMPVNSEGFGESNREGSTGESIPYRLWSESAVSGWSRDRERRAASVPCRCREQILDEKPRRGRSYRASPMSAWRELREQTASKGERKKLTTAPRYCSIVRKILRTCSSIETVCKVFRSVSRAFDEKLLDAQVVKTTHLLPR